MSGTAHENAEDAYEPTAEELEIECKPMLISLLGLLV